MFSLGSGSGKCGHMGGQTFLERDVIAIYLYLNRGCVPACTPRPLSPSASDPMAYVGRIDAAGSVYGMQLNALTGALYAGFYDYAVTAQMWTTSRDGSLPNAVGTFDLGQGEAIYTNKVRDEHTKPERSCPPSLLVKSLTACAHALHHKRFESRRSSSIRSAISSTSSASPMIPSQKPRGSTFSTWVTAQRSRPSLTRSRLVCTLDWRAPASKSSFDEEAQEVHCYCQAQGDPN